MSDEKTSPGPWRWASDDEEDFGSGAILLDHNGARVCNFGGGMEHEEEAGTPPAPADAALIADAPAMLELLRVLEFSGLKDGHSSCQFCHARPGAPHAECRLGAVLDKHGRG